MGGVGALIAVAAFGLGLMVSPIASSIWSRCLLPRAWFQWAWWRVCLDFGDEPPPSWVEFREGFLAAIEEERVLEERAMLEGETGW